MRKIRRGIGKILRKHSGKRGVRVEVIKTPKCLKAHLLHIHNMFTETYIIFNFRKSTVWIIYYAISAFRNLRLRSPITSSVTLQPLRRTGAGGGRRKLYVIGSAMSRHLLMHAKYEYPLLKICNAPGYSEMRK